MNFFAFDTRDTKPRLRMLLAVTLAAVALLVFFLTTAPEASIGPVTVMAVYSFAAVALLLIAFREQIRYNPYSYNTIFYFGFALFGLSVGVTNVILAVDILSAPALYSPAAVIRAALESAKAYMFLSFPFLAVFSAALCVSNAVLIRREGRRFVNVLGVVLSFFLMAGVAFLFFFDSAGSFSTSAALIHDLFAYLFAAVYLYFECMLIGTMVADAIAARYEPKPDKDFIIILGCGLKQDGSPTPLLQGRIDRALTFAEKQEKLTGKAPVFVTSGGKGPDEAISESLAMKRYLLSRGVPEERILEEDRSTTTFENMKYSKEKICAVDPGARIAFSTTNYHVFRSGLFARRVKMRAVGMGAKTKWYFWPNAAVREFAGLLTHHQVKQALILGGLIAVYATLTVLVYTL